MVEEVALFDVVRPVAAGFQPKRQARAVEPALEPVQGILMADRLANDREVAGVSRRHGGEYGLDGGEGRLPRHQVGNVAFRHDQHDVLPFVRPCAASEGTRAHERNFRPVPSRIPPAAKGWS